MAQPRPILPLANEEVARLKWFEAFMRGRVELEQQTMSGLQELLKGAPVLPERKLLWHCALEKVLDGTREELHARIEELEILKDQMQAVGNSVIKAEMCIRDLDIEFDKLESAENVDSAQAATMTLHENWLDISAKKGLSDLFSSGRAQKEKVGHQRTTKSYEAFSEYYEQGESRKDDHQVDLMQFLDLKYRRAVHQQRKSQEKLLKSIPDRIQEHGTKYWTAVRDVGMVMESFANYIRNISSTCNSSGSAIWASAKNIKSLVDANCHTEAIELVYHQSPIRFSPIYYRNPGSKSRSPSGQTILFGYPPELRTAGELKKVPPILEYLLDLGRDGHVPHSTRHNSAELWSLVNEIEQAWTGVEESDRGMVSQLFKGYQTFLIRGYFFTLPKPVLSKNDIRLARNVKNGRASSPKLTWNTWSKDPIKKAVFVAINPWIVDGQPLRTVMVCALAQDWDLFGDLHVVDALCAYHDSLKGPVTNVEEESQ